MTSTKKHWSLKVPFILSQVRSFLGDKVNESNISWFIEEFLPLEEKRHKREFFIKSQKGQINSKFTPVDMDGTFEKVSNPRIGFRYHLSWAFKGAVFKLIEVDTDGIHGYVDNPKNKRASLLKIKLSDLRKTRR